MDSSSTARGPYGQPAQRDPRAEVAPTKAYRRNRQHLFPLEELKAAMAIGGIVRSYCGIDELIRQGDPECVVAVTEPEPDDCVTCVDVWSGCRRVRL